MTSPDMPERRRRRSRTRSPDQRRGPTRQRSEEGMHQRKVTQSLPFNAPTLSKHHLRDYKAMFALYLDIQKGIDIDDLQTDEVKGRWKSYVNKWNRGDLAEGWYDSNTLKKARQAGMMAEDAAEEAAVKEHDVNHRRVSEAWSDSLQDNDDGDDFGPALPQQVEVVKRKADTALKHGPFVPSLNDLRCRDEDARLQTDEAREQVRSARKLDRKIQREKLDEIAPRADTGTRERQLEQKRDVASSNRHFASLKDAGGDADIPESDAMGGDDLNDLRRMKKESEKRKSEREIKRDEILRARNAEREERSQRLRAKEEKTMDMLKGLARSRFGDGNVHPATLRDP